MSDGQAVTVAHPQLTLGLALRESARFASYFPGDNREAVDTLQAATTGQGEQLVFIVAAAGMGKTHLLQAASYLAGEQDRATAYLPLRDLLMLSPSVFADLEQLAVLCIDDVQMIAGNDQWERALFDLFNRARAAGTVLLFAADSKPGQCGFTLPDLATRLAWGVTYVLKALDDTEVIAALAHRAQGRGLMLPDETAQYLLKRIPRDLPSVFDLLDRLDEASMIEQRRLTIPFVKSVLGGSGESRSEHIFS
jgi:DnaA family protein